MNWWQMDGALPDTGASTAVAACVAIYAEEAGRTNFVHYKRLPDGSSVAVKNSPVMKILNNPNGYQTRYEFIAFLVANLYYKGNSYAYAVQNASGTVLRLIPITPEACVPYINPMDGDIYYRVSRQPWNDQADFQENEFVLADKILHLRINAKTHPLTGTTPISSVLLSAETGVVVQQQNRKFFQNMSRTSGILSTPQKLSPELAARLSEAFKSRSAGQGIGGVPILDSDLKFFPMGMSAVDSELIRVYKQTNEDIAMIFRVPRELLGISSEAGAAKTPETIMRTFISMGLGAMYANLEQAFTKFWQLPEDEYIEADIEGSLSRGDLKERMDALAKAVQGGVFSPNEARRREGLGPKEGGDEIFLQQQMVPVKIAVEAPQFKEEPIPEPDAKPVADNEKDEARYLTALSIDHE